MAEQNIKNKVALVTGGNRGIGMEVCRSLAQKGARVLLGARDEKSGAEAAGSIRKEGIDIRVEIIDVANLSSIHAFTERIADSVDILVNNAAILDRAPFLRIPQSEIAAALETNLRGPILLSQHCANG